MSDYLITTDTGEQFIAHYGVKGQKWGVWNPETTARYNGLSLAPGGGSLKEDEEDEEKDEKQSRPFLKKMGEMGAEALDDLASDTGAKAKVDETVKDALVAKAYSEAGDRLSEPEREELREKVRSQRKEEVRRRREEARKNGNPLWVFM